MGGGGEGARLELEPRPRRWRRLLLPPASASGPPPSSRGSPEAEAGGSHLRPHEPAWPSQHPTLEPFLTRISAVKPGAGRAGRVRRGPLCILIPHPNLVSPVLRVLGGCQLPPGNASIHPPIHPRADVPTGPQKVPCAPPALPISPGLGSCPQHLPPAPPTAALVLLRKASPAIMFSSHFLHLLGWREVASVAPLPGHCTKFDSFLH